MVNFKIKQSNTIPEQAEAGCLYFLSSGEIHLGKTDGTFLSFSRGSSAELEALLLDLQTELEGKANQADLDAVNQTLQYYREGIEALASKVDKDDLDTALSEFYTNTSDNIMGLYEQIQTKANQANLDSVVETLQYYREGIEASISTLDDRTINHEKALITDSSGLHGIRIWQGKLEEFNEETAEWVEVISSGAPTEHTHTTDEILGLTEFVNNLIAGLATGEIELTDASLVAKGIVQLSNAIDSEDETKASTPLALKTAINEIKNIYNQAIEDVVVESKEYTDTEIAKLNTLSDDAYATKEHTHAISDVNNLQTTLDLKVNQVDLESLREDFNDAMLDVSPLAHNHTIPEVDGLQGVLDSKSDKTTMDSLTNEVDSLETKVTIINSDLDNTKIKVNANTTEITGINAQLANGVASAIHTHPISAVNLLQDSLDAKANRTDVQTLANNFNIHKHVISEVNDLQAELDGRALKTEFNILKTNFDGHKHEITDVNLLQDTLANKSPLSHTHTWNQITGRPTATTSQIDASVDKSHLHANINILENLEDGNGVLIYNGTPLGEVAYISVETIQDRDTIPMTARKEGLMVLVIEDGGMYYLKGGIDNAFWQIFATGAGGATNASTLPANPVGGLTGTNTQALIEQLETRKANINNVYSKAEMETFMQNYPIDYLTLDNLPNLSQLHGHENLETLNLFNQYQGNLTWKGKTLGDLMTEIYDADKDGVIDIASKLDGQISTITELNYLSGATGNIQSQINSLSSGTTYRGEYPTYQEMIDTINNPSKGDWVFILSDENKGAENTQYLHDGVDWIYGGGTTKTPDTTPTTKGVIQLGGDLAHPSSTASAPKLTATGVTSGLYKSANITVGEDGRILNAEEGSVVFLNDTIVSEDEGWSSSKISEELQKYSPSNHTHTQLHKANMLGTVELDESGSPENNTVISYDSTSGKAKWTEPSGGKFFIGSKSIKGDLTIEAGSYISLLVDEDSGKLVINSTYRENGGNVVPTGFQILDTVEVDANSKVRLSVQSPFNKFMLHTIQMSNDKDVISEIRLYDQSVGGFIEYNSNPEMVISDILTIPIFDNDNSKMAHIEIENLGIESAKFKFRLKCTNLL